ncbi:MAG TPA: hypothetical protein PKX59_05105, partial [Bacteroidia bacterium]|nr:hypothetical protein [Bacteroidia bacterium]
MWRRIPVAGLFDDSKKGCKGKKICKFPGGSFFPNYVQALHHTPKQHDYDFRLLDMVMKVNKTQ